MLHNTENNSYDSLILLLNGYCGFNDMIPDHYEKSYIKEISHLLTEHYDYQEQNTPSIFMNAGGLLLQLQQCIELEAVSKEDGLRYIFDIMLNKHGINITEFYNNSPLIQLLTYNNNKNIIHGKYHCWIKMILDISSAQDIPKNVRLLLSHPYFSSSGKSGMISSLIENINEYFYNPIKIISHSIDILYSTEQELLDLFLMAIQNQKITIAIYLFNHAHQLPIPKKTAQYSNNKKIECEILLLKLLLTQVKHKIIINSLFITTLLDHAATLEKDTTLFNTQPITTIDIYKMLIINHKLIPKNEIIKNKFIQVFIPDINKFFHLSISRCLNIRFIAIDLLESNIPGINISQNCLSINKKYKNHMSKLYDPNFVNYFYFDYSLSDINNYQPKMTALQAVIMLITVDQSISFQHIYLIKSLIEYDMRCLYQKDSHGKTIYDYLNAIKRNDSFNDDLGKLLRFINRKYYHFNKVSTFFAGSRKYDADCHSIISELPHEVVSEIASLTMMNSHR